MKVTVIVALLVLILALPFAFRHRAAATDWQAGDPVLVVVSPHNQAIRDEFGRAFSAWRKAHGQRPVFVDWRTIGGTTEIMRYLEGQYTAAMRSWRRGAGRAWPAWAGSALFDRSFDASRAPADPAAAAGWAARRDLYLDFRTNDNPAAFSSGIDLFFGGGAYDHGVAGSEGLTVPLWAGGRPPPDTVFAANGRELIPARFGGEIWRTETYCGTAVSAFGICYNPDRLRELGVAPPRKWEDLGNPGLVGQVAVVDPSKSGSIAKAFEMIVQAQCWKAVRAAGYSGDDVERFEALLARSARASAGAPDGVPAGYQQAIEEGWRQGVLLLQRIGANARSFTDSGSKAAIDVAAGDAAAGIVIDLFGRTQAEFSHDARGRACLVYVTPEGGSSVSADPISLLRGAPHRALAEEFIAFVLSEEGQRLWCTRPGEPGGPAHRALRRLPIRRDFYPCADTNECQAYARYAASFADDFSDPQVNPYVIGAAFTYQPRWTGAHFGILRDLVRAMCLDAGDELREAWRAILDAGAPGDAQPAALAMLERLPEKPLPLTWAGALRIPREHRRLDYLRDWTRFFRRSYSEARDACRQAGKSAGTGQGNDATHERKPVEPPQRPPSG